MALACSLASLHGVAAPSAPAPDPVQWRWRSASALRSVAWPDVEGKAPEALDPEAPIRLTPDRLVLVPVDAGDQVRLTGQAVEVGLASGARDMYPDAITWQAAPAPPIVRIPMWSSARFLALRAAQPADVRVEVTARVFDSLAAHRLDEKVHAWLGGRVAEPPAGANAEQRRALSALQGLVQLWQTALGDRAQAAPAPAPLPALLHRVWLEQRLKRTPLPEPFFVVQPAALSGGRPLLTAGADAAGDDEEWRLLAAGETLGVPLLAADVVSVQLRARALGQTRVQVWSGDLLVHDTLFEIPRRAEHPERFTPSRVLRVVPRASHAALRVLVIEGSARVHIDVRSAEHGLLEASSAHRPSAAGRAALRGLAGAPAWLSALAAFLTEGTQATLERVEQHLVSAQVAGSAAAADAKSALLLYASLPALSQRPSLPGDLGRFWSATAALPVERRTALRIALLERLQDTLPQPLHVETCPAAFDETREAASGHGVDAELLRALLETVIGTRDGLRPEPMATLEALAARQANDAQLVDLTRSAWSKGARWRALAAPKATRRMLHRRPSDSNEPGGLCQNRGPRGLRWWIVPRTPTDVEVLDLGGTHSALRLLPLDPTDLHGAEVLMDEQTIRVQPALGAASEIGVRPGTHRISQRSGGTLVARIPRLGSSRCEELRELERWFALDEELVFQIPGGSGSSVASVIVDPTSLPEQGAALQVEIDGRIGVAWLRSPASGDVELEIPAGATELRVRSDRPLLVRARARMHPKAPRAEAPLDIRPAAPGVDLLGEVERLSVALERTTAGAERDALRSERAEALHALGYPELAELDWTRAQRQGTARRRSAPGALFLPEHPEPVVPRGLAARAPLLPLADPELVARALEHQGVGRSDRALELLRGAGAAQASDASGLLTAELASDQGDPATAAPILERLAHAHANGALFEAAAREYDRWATGTFSLEHARRAFLLAQLATQHDPQTRSLLSRYDAHVDWKVPSLSTLGNSSVRVESSLPGQPVTSLGSQLRRALLRAPAEAWLLADEATFNVRRWREQTLHVSSLCFNQEGPLEGCRAEWLLDGEPLSCASGGETDVAEPQECSIPLGYHSRELSVRLPAAKDRMGWALLQLQSADDPTRRSPLVWRESYASLGPEAPIQLHVGGPGALRIEARALGSEPATLRLSARRLADPGSGLAPSASTQLLEIPALFDGATIADGADTSQAVSKAQRLEYVVVGAGVHEITLAATAGALLVRPEVADVTSFPHTRQLGPPPLEPGVTSRAPLQAADVSGAQLELTAVSDLFETPPLSLSAELTVRDRDLAEADADAGDRYAESALVARKGLFDDRLWLELAGFHRARGGASSLGAELAASSSPEGPWPGLFTSARLVAQPALEARGLIANIGARHRVPILPSMNLLPAVSAIWRVTEPRASPRADVDGDVYSGYATRRPYSFDVEALLSQRLATDFLGRYGLFARLNQDLKDFDRIEIEGKLDLLPGAGFAPWLSLALSASHRPASVLREHPFTRFQVAPAAMFWHWLGAGQRLRAEANLSLFVDAPNPSGSRAGMFASLLLGYDFWLGDGLRDFRSSSRLYRARLEEGGPPHAPGAPANDTYWLEADEP